MPNTSIVRVTFPRYMLYRQLVHPAETNGPGDVYGKLLPFLLERPLSACSAAHVPKGWSALEPVPVSGDGFYACCAEHAVRFCLTALGVSPLEARWGAAVLQGSETGVE